MTSAWPHHNNVAIWSPAASGILGLVCGYAPRHWDRKLLVMLQAYVDDSSTDTGDRRLHLAAYVMPATRWASFTVHWDETLRRNPPIDYLHMVEAENLRGQFRGWQPEERNAKVLRFANVVHVYEPWSFEYSISRKDYDETVPDFEILGVGSPYFMCFYGLIIGIANLHRQLGLSVPVDFIFDEQGRHGLDVASLYYGMKKALPEAFQKVLGGPPIFRDDKDILPLQAADLLAWHIRRESSDGAMRPISAWLKPHHFSASMKRPTLEKAAEQLSKIDDAPARSKSERRAKKELLSLILELDGEN